GRFSGNFSAQVFNETVHPPKGGVTAAPVDPLVLGRAAYAQVCANCHMATGMGVPGAFPPLAGSEWVVGSPERLIRIVLHGLEGPIEVAGVQYPGSLMPAT